MQPCRLAASDIACRRGDRILFRGLSLSLGPGDAVLLTGPNGVGKSSLLRILAGLLRPFAGSVERAGEVALIDERHALDRDLALDRALAFWAGLDGAREVAQVIERVGLARQRDVPVAYLSTGQRKRAALARVLIQGAPIWLLDEPFNGLDGEGSAILNEAVAEHRQAGGMVVIASHLAIAMPGAHHVSLGAA